MRLALRSVYRVGLPQRISPKVTLEDEATAFRDNAAIENMHTKNPRTLGLILLMNEYYNLHKVSYCDIVSIFSRHDVCAMIYFDGNEKPQIQTFQSACPS